MSLREKNIRGEIISPRLTLMYRIILILVISLHIKH